MGVHAGAIAVHTSLRVRVPHLVEVNALVGQRVLERTLRRRDLTGVPGFLVGACGDLEEDSRVQVIQAQGRVRHGRPAAGGHDGRF